MNYVFATFACHVLQPGAAIPQCKELPLMRICSFITKLFCCKIEGFGKKTDGDWLASLSNGYKNRDFWPALCNWLYLGNEAS